jgi:type II secretory pathway pseudopilin PulG
MEVMVVLAIIAVLTMAALPNLLTGRHAQRIKAATDETMDILQFSKVRASNDFNAYGVEVDPTEGSGVIRVYEGSGPACSGIAWDTPLRSLVFVDDFGPADGDIRIIGILPASVSRLCFTPNGRLVDAMTDKPVPSTHGQYGAGEYIISLQGHLNGGPVGLTHHVVLSYSGKARFTFGDDPLGAEGEGGT